jgi:hypothetical protein
LLERIRDRCNPCVTLCVLLGQNPGNLALDARRIRMHASEFFIAREEPPFGLSPEQDAAGVKDVLDSVGDACPECPPEGES